MMRTILGPEKYRKATDLYFSRHDGHAATCEDFIKCMEDASGVDLKQFRLWYEQAGTPEITFKGSYDGAAKTYKIELSQSTPPTPGQPSKKPMHIPVTVGLVNDNGADVAQETLQLTQAKQTFEIKNVASAPIPSILRNFSAPVKLKTDLSNDDLTFLMVHDSDGFNRWDAGQTYMLRVLNGMIDSGGDAPEGFYDIYRDLLDRALDPRSDKALMARAISVPDISIIARERKVIDPQAIHEAREKLLNSIIERFAGRLEKIYAANRTGKEFLITAEAMGKRTLQNTAMLLRANRLTDEDAAMGLAHYKEANNMTDRMAALFLGCALDGAAHDEIVGDFYKRFKSYQLVVDKWFSAQAAIHLPKTVDVVRKLRNHPDFNIKNPNRVRSLYSSFAMNPVRFHAADGSGYEFLGDAIIELNAINPQIASRLVTPFRDWKNYTKDRQEKMKAVLNKIHALPKISPDVFEIVDKSLKA